MNNCTTKDMHDFLFKWECMCGTCILCEACLQVYKKLQEEEE